MSLEAQLPETKSRHEYIADYYIALIRDGRIREGEQIPGRAEICKVWGVKQKTAQMALWLLRDRGWAVTIERHGSFATRGTP